MAASHPFFRGGFRPFFAGGAAWALVALVTWLAELAGGITLPSHFDALAWHRHEMLFGFVGAVVVGFLLTAIPNWTGRLPIAGGPLGLLFATWAAARVAVLFSKEVGALAAALIDVGFYLAFAAIAAREVLAAQNRNIPVVGLVLLFAGANALDHLGAAGVIDDAEMGFRAGIALVILMIALIGGRVIPSFTRNWLAKQGTEDGPTQPNRFDLLVILLTAAAMACWVVASTSFATGVLLLIAGALQVARLARWSGLHTFSEPLVLILHVGYAWVPLGLCLLALSIFSEVVQRSGAVHALTAGAMGTMILAVMTRATLGHTGRELKNDGWTSAIYLMVTLGAALRVAAPALPFDYMHLLSSAGALWGGSFLLFLLVYGPKLATPRVETVA